MTVYLVDCPFRPPLIDQRLRTCVERIQGFPMCPKPNFDIAELQITLYTNAGNRISAEFTVSEIQVTRRKFQKTALAVL